MCLLGRLIGRHKFIYPEYYSIVTRFVRREVKNGSRLYAFIAESVHDRSPLDDIENLCKRFISNFISESL